MKRALLCLTLLLCACRGDETVAAYGAAGDVWQLTEVDGAPVAYTAVIRFGADGTVTGRAPCNSYSARQTAPYPWFELGPIRVTRRACPALRSEAAYLSALRAMTLAETSSDVLILSNDAGRSMVFTRTPG